MPHTLERDEILQLIAGLRHCSQIVIGQWAEDLGMDEETAVRLMAPFGGGAFEGEVCGAVAGALAVIGAKYGHYEFGDAEQNQIMIGKATEFKQKFKERNGSIVCRNLLGDFDFSKPGEVERAQQSGVLLEKCPDFIGSALEILEEVMED